MVRGIVTGLAALECVSPVAAQTADWTRAGGSLFAGAEIAAPEPPVEAETRGRTDPEPLQEPRHDLR